MNLIEQLGGYEAAKAKIGQINHTLENSELLGGGDAREGLYERLESIDKALLEYRRQHNIFEVGDKVVFKDGSHALDRCDLGSGEVLVIKDIDFYDYLIFECSPHGHGQKWFRHATDEEIAAGKRL